MIALGLRNLTEEGIEVLGPRSVILGAWDYFLGDKVRKAVVYRDRLRGEVAANSGDYRPVVRAKDEGQLSSECDCPSRLPFCKHAVALLYLWVNRPREFTDLEGLTAPLVLLPPEELAEILASALMAGDDGVSLVRRTALEADLIMSRALNAGLAALLREAVEACSGGAYAESVGTLLWILKYGPGLFLGQPNREILAQVPGYYRDALVAWNPDSGEILSQLTALTDLVVPATDPGLAEGVEQSLTDLWAHFETRLGEGNRVIEARLQGLIWGLESSLAAGFRPGMAYRQARLLKILVARLRARGDEPAVARLLQDHPR